MVNPVNHGFKSYGIKLWSGNKYKNTLMQGFHVTWSIGGSLGPFITKSFLCEIEVDDHFNETSNIWNSSFTNSSPHSGNFSSACKDGRDLNSVKYAFITIAFIMFSANIPYVTAFIFKAVKKKQFLIKRRSKTESTSEEQQIIPKNKFQQNVRLKVILLTFFFFLGLLNYYTEGITSFFPTAFALKYLQWSVAQSASLLSLFYGAQISCRILGVVVSVFLRPRTMLAITMSLLVITGH
ncbi:hypothetical protein HELRODRAFT_168599 [Helobdella robusta]|uniref:Uncharacterized protein n=1 Tax=Helobdella robusta TaxID=6412 RepID=T1F0S2_HELRO|nr:hypothetical protein HELRODRAFT_168599 [Helobdella robusta]ESO09590.1 hypothetical protein HELRODRAFT_168599 [Helobdella robusta]